MQAVAYTYRENVLTSAKSGKNARRGYLFGFNGHEKDNEVYGDNNSYTAEFWQYDPRLGRRWNVDPVPQISVSDYACFRNNPIYNVDIKGAKSDGWIEDKQTGKMEWDENVNSAEDFAGSGYDKDRFLYRGQENIGSLDPDGMVPVTYNDPSGKSHDLAEWLNPVVITETTLQTSLKNQRDRYWEEGDWLKAAEYEIKQRTGKTNDHVSQQQAYNLMLGTTAVVASTFTLGAAGSIFEYGAGVLGLTNGFDDVLSDSDGNSYLQQQFPENKGVVTFGKTVASGITISGSVISLYKGSLVPTTDVLGAAVDAVSIGRTVNNEKKKQ